LARVIVTVISRPVARLTIMHYALWEGNMKIKLLIGCFFLCFSLLIADNFDFSNWVIKLQTNENPVQQLALQQSLITSAKNIVKNQLFDATRTVEDYLTQNLKISRQYDRLTLNIKQSDVRFLSDGATIYEYELPITGSILKLLIPNTGGGIPVSTLCCPTCGQLWPENQLIPDGVKLVPLENELTPQYTGVLIDAREITVNPCLFPKILSDENKEVYGLSFASAEYVTEQGLVKYTTSFSDAYQSDLLGINPLRITALKSLGENKTDIVISSASAKMMHSSQHNLKLLEQCRVVILLAEQKN